MINLDKSLLSGDHEKIDLTDEQKNKLTQMEKDGLIGKFGNKSKSHALREMRSKKNGLLLIYPIYGKQKSDNDANITEEAEKYGIGDDIFPAFGCVISFSGEFEKGTEISYIFDQKSIEQMDWFEQWKI